MTLHIPHGVRVTGVLADPFALSRLMQPTLLDLAQTLYYRALAGEVARHIDAVRAGRPGPLRDIRGYPDVLRAAANATSAHVISATTDKVRRDPEYDLGFTMKILPDPSTPDALLAIMLTEHEEYRQAVLRLPGVTNYSYVASHGDLDRARHTTWAGALNNGRSDLGWEWSLLSNMPAIDLRVLNRAPDPVKVIAALPSDARRAHDLAGALVVLTDDGTADTYAVLSQFQDESRRLLPTARAALAPITVEDLTPAQ